MEDWDQETVNKVVESKKTEHNQNKPTDIVCFIIFVEIIGFKLICFVGIVVLLFISLKQWMKRFPLSFLWFKYSYFYFGVFVVDFEFIIGTSSLSRPKRKAWILIYVCITNFYLFALHKFIYFFFFCMLFLFFRFSVFYMFQSETVVIAAHLKLVRV